MEPVFYPAVDFINGRVPKGTGVWRDLLGDHPLGLLNRNPPLPLLTSALHFLNHRISPMALSHWRSKPLREHYPQGWTGELFVDSGGFMLIMDPYLDLSRYGIQSDRLPEGILELQLDYGADRIASLDWPIPPGLDPEEAKRRQRLTLEATLRTGRRLAELPPHRRPKWLVPVHGLDPDDLAQFTQNTLNALKAEGLIELVDGVAVGSLVPRRLRYLYGEVVAFIRAVRRVVPEGMRIHAFGMSGLIVPFLMAEGATSFDATSYIKNAIYGIYIHPKTYARIRLFEMKDWDRYPCDCPICVGRSPMEDAAIVYGKTKGSISSIYSLLAIHNLEVDLDIFRKSKEALLAGEINRFLGELTLRLPNLILPGIPFRSPKLFEATPIRGVRQHTPDDYDLRKRNWNPNPKKRCVLFVPCSKQKPYTSSQSFKKVWRALIRELGGWIDEIQVVFISGLYGPVPIEDVHEDPIVSYDFLLHPADKEGIDRIAERIAAFWEKYGHLFPIKVAFCPIYAYRQALKKGSKNVKDLLIFQKWKDLPDLVQTIYFNLTQTGGGYGH